MVRSRDPLFGALLILGVGGALASLVFFRTVFPIVPLALKVLPPAAQNLARNFLEQQGYSLQGYHVVTTFEVDEAGRDYLQRRLGLDALISRSREGLPLWSWRVRFFRALQKEEYQVRLSPEGRVIGFAHLLPEDEPRPSLAEGAALTKALEALRQLGFDLASYRLIETLRLERPQRQDYAFVWEYPASGLADAPLRLEATVQGDRWDRFRWYVKVPEAWLRQQRQEIEQGRVLAQVGWALTAALILAAGGVFLFALRRHRLPWSFAAGLVGLLVLVTLVAALNGLPLILASYPTTASLEGFVLGQLLRQAAAWLPQGLVILLVGVSGGVLYSRQLPHLLSLHRLGTWAGLCSREMRVGIGVGYALTGLWLGYLVLYYSLGERLLGFWTPAQVPYRDVMSTLLPVAFPLTVGVGAAVSEEFLFRLLAVPLLLAAGARLFRQPPFPQRVAPTAAVALAVILPALVWGSLHATWPQQPFWVRVGEVSVAGVVLGLTLLRFGIVAVLVNHYVSNATLVGAFFWLTGNPSLQLAGVLAVLFPLLLLVPGAIARAQGRRALAKEGVAALEPLQLSATVPPPGVHARKPLQPIGWRAILSLTVVATAAVALVLLFSPERPGAFLSLRVAPEEAEQRARRYLEESGLPAEGWHTAVTLLDLSGGNDVTYLLRHLGIAGTNRFLAAELAPYRWQVRFFKPLRQESILVGITPGGEPWGHRYVQEETAPGADLPPEEALQLATAFAGRLLGDDVLGYRLVDASSQKRSARTDHLFVWERPHYQVGEGTPRLAVEVQGDKVASLRPFLKVPESFERERARQTLADVALRAAQQGLLGGMALGLLLLFLQQWRRHLIDLRFATLLALGIALLSFVKESNDAPKILASYRDTMSLPGYWVWAGAGKFPGLLFLFAQSFVVVGLAEALFRQRFGPLPRLWPPSQEERPYCLQTALAITLVLPLLWAGRALAPALGEALAPQSLTPWREEALAYLDAWLPALASMAGNLGASLRGVFLGTALLLTALLRVRNPWLLVAVAWVGLSLLTLERFEGAMALLLHLSPWLAMVLGGFLLVRRFLKHYLWGYLLLAWAALSLRDAWLLLQQGHPLFWVNGALLAGVGVLPVGILLVLAGLRRRRIGAG